MVLRGSFLGREAELVLKGSWPGKEHGFRAHTDLTFKVTSAT